MNFCVTILILKMKENTHFQHTILYYFKKGKNTPEMQQKICAVYGKWFLKFCAWDFLLDNASWLGRTVEVDSNQIETLIKNNQHYTMREIDDILKNIQIKKVIVENEKCLLFSGKKHTNFFCQPSSWLTSCKKNKPK